MKTDWKEWLIHLLIVVLCLVFLNNPTFDLTYGVFRSGDGTEGSLLWPSIYGAFFNLLIFYGISFYLIPFILRKHSKGHFLLSIFVFCSIVTVIEVAMDAAVLRNIEQKSLSEEKWEEIFMMVAFVHLFFIMLSFAYRFSKDWFANEELKKNISEWQTKSELEILKSQINPHFLFNALNNLFSMALKNGDDPTAEGIAKLSDMMRYVLEGTAKEFVAIDDEIAYIKNYIFLQQLRFEDHLTVETVFPESYSHKVAPMLFIPFIENAFKYGVSTQRKTNIEVQLKSESDQVNFTCISELVQSKESIPSHGIGIQNVLKRLKMIYPDMHELKYGEVGDKYVVSLSLSI